MIKKVKVEEAIGMILAHDMTKIVPGEFKGVAFKKGHIVSEKDIDELKSMGKNHIYILELDKGSIHEEEAAVRIAKAAAPSGLEFIGPNEGKIKIVAKHKGLLKIDVDSLLKINEIEDIVLATLHNNTLVEEGKLVASAKIIPLVTEKEKIEQVEKIAEENAPIISLKKTKNYKIGVVITGTEVYEGIIQDRFGPLLKQKALDYGCNVFGIKYAKDDINMIKDSIEGLISNGCEIIITSGGMSVDPDDITPFAIKEVASDVVTYGSPVIPGAMFMLAYKGEIPILGLPACGMFFKVTVLDLVLKRVIAGEKVSKKEMAALAHGGLCQSCEVCHYPVCPLGN